MTTVKRRSEENALIGLNHDAKLVRGYLTTRAPIKFEPPVAPAA